MFQKLALLGLSLFGIDDHGLWTLVDAESPDTEDFAAEPEEKYRVGREIPAPEPSGL